MTREEYVKKVKEIMIKKNPYGRFHQQNFTTYNNLGEMAPINSAILNDMPSEKIILSWDAYQYLLAISEVTNETLQEFPFFLYGKETSSNQIEFNEFRSSSKDRQNTSVSFNQIMIESLQKKIAENIQNGLVVCHGHSHPPIGSFHQNFSLGDFTSFMEMNGKSSF